MSSKTNKSRHILSHEDNEMMRPVEVKRR